MANSGLLKRRTGELPRKQASTGKLISAHYLEVEYLLDLVERSTNYYQTLGIERTATVEEVIGAYHKAVQTLHPSYHKVRASIPDQMLKRVDEVFERISKAFTILTDFRKRAEYDQSLMHRARATPPVQSLQSQQQEVVSAAPKFDNTEANGQFSVGRASQSPRTPPAQMPIRHKAIPNSFQSDNKESIAIKESSEQQTVYTVASTDAPKDQRRRCERFRLSIPVLVAGCDQVSGKWQEMTKCFDVSRLGIGIRLSRRLQTGMVVHITMPMPAKLRTHGYSDQSYNVYAIVRRVELPENEMRVIGLEFLGERPPSLYLHKPWATFQTHKWSGVDRRREKRVHRSEKVKIEFLNENLQVMERENGVTENISPSGARVSVKSAPSECDVVKLTCTRCRFESRALIRNRYTGRDGAERLCLQFLDNKWHL